MLPDDYNSSEFIDQWKQLASQRILVNDPTTSINTVPGTTTDGLWSQINKTNTYNPVDPLEQKMIQMEMQMELVKLDVKLMRLKILSLEGKFSQEEVTNIRSMLTSQD
jgi:hypothetical protein